MTLGHVNEVDEQIYDDYSDDYGATLGNSLCYYSYHPGARSHVLTLECEMVGKDDLYLLSN